MSAEDSPGLLDRDAIEALFQAGKHAEAAAAGLRLAAEKDKHGEAMIVIARASFQQGDLAEAIRWADRAARLSPKSVSTVNFLAALLLVKGDSLAALQALEPFSTEELTPEAMVVRCRALLATGQPDQALNNALGALRDFPVLANPLLADFLDRHIDDLGFPGWYGLDIGHLLVGRLPVGVAGGDHERESGPEQAPVRLEADGIVQFELPLAQFRQRYPAMRDNRPEGSFAIELPVSLNDRRIVMSYDGRPLAGPEIVPPRRLRVEGDAAITDNILSGWAWLPALPGNRLSIRVTDGHGHAVTVVADEPLAVLRRVNIGDAAYGFTLPLPGSGLKPGHLSVQALAEGLQVEGGLLAGERIAWSGHGSTGTMAAELAVALRQGRGLTPDGELRDALVAALSGIPAPVPETPPERHGPLPPPAPGIDIIIPVYRGRDETLACIRSVLETVPSHTRIVVIDDASPEPELSRALATLSAGRAITLLVNPDNLGFPKSVNRGLAFAAGRDVVLLNSDTLVHGDWLERLRAAAYSSRDIGTVTPLSNDADILSYPSPPDPPEEEGYGAGKTARPVSVADDWAARHELARRCNDGERVEIPTAVGFCTFIRHDCLAEVGPLETELFGRGYGEENDFCMRARRLGWRHVAATDVFVAHIGSHSFGRRRLPLVERNLRALNARHPGYDELVQRFFADNPLVSARRRMDLARWTADPERPARLIVTFRRSGGVARFVEERLRALGEAGERFLLLRPADLASSEPRLCRIEDPEQPELRDMVFSTTAEMELLIGALQRAGVGRIEYQHYLDHDLSVLELPARLNVPYDVYLHDYIWICPQITLIDPSDRYCGERGPAHCADCLAQKKPHSGETITVPELRRRSARFLAAASRIVAPSHDVAKRITRHLGALPIQVVPWEQVTPVPYRPAKPASGRLRVCVIGAIGRHKGFDVLLECARDAVRRDLPLEFVLVGFSEDDAALFATGRIFVTGAFRETELPGLIRRQKAHVAFLPSVWPETWSYVLSHAWNAGLSVVAFNLGAIVERIGRTGGVCLPPDLPPSAINDFFLAPAVPGVSHPTPLNAGSTTMLPTSSALMAGQAPSDASQVKASTQQFTFVPGLYCISVKPGAGPVAPAQGPGGLPLPSIHVTALPGQAGSVTILGQDDGWLFRQGAALVVRISGTGPGSVLLNSYQGQNQPAGALNIQINRLDASATAEQAAPVPALSAPGNPGNALVAASPAVRIQMMAHVQNMGDVAAPEGGWAGSPHKGNAVEGFAIMPVEGLPANGIEYKGLDARGQETPWLSGGNLCGSRGQNNPLVGMAVRLQGPYAERFDCITEILYLSGARSPALSNGQPHRSDRLGDPIQAFNVRIVERGVAPARPVF